MRSFELHPHLDTVELFVMGLLPKHRAQEVKQHVAKCRECQYMEGKLRLIFRLNPEFFRSPSELVH